MEAKELMHLIDIEIQKMNLAREPQELYEPIRYILSLGGKRARPALLLMSYQLFNEQIDDALPAALAIEVFHNFTLLHDDLMDHANVRRGQPTVHKKWNNNVAILSGDAMLIKAYDILGNTPARLLTPVYAEFNKVALEVCEGQQYDMEFEQRMDVTIEEYLEMIRLKTAVLLASSIKMGAIIGDASKKIQEQLYEMALNAGIGFQLMDDYLDTFGDANVFGKKIGGDILENKKTFLLITALNQVKGTDASMLKSWLKSEDRSDEKISGVRTIYDKLEIGEQTLEKSKEYFIRSEALLAEMDLPEKPKTILSDFLSALTQRNK